MPACGCPERLPCEEFHMNHLNTVLIEGQLTRNPEIGNAPAQIQMCRLSVANNRYRLKNGEWEQDTSYFTVYVYGNVAEACLARLKKGRGVRIVGRLKQLYRSEGGYRTEKILILAEHIEFQPEKKNEVLKEPGREPGEIITKTDHTAFEDSPADAAVPATAATAVPETQEPKDTPSDVPECTIDSEEDSVTDDSPADDFEKEFGQEAC